MLYLGEQEMSQQDYSDRCENCLEKIDYCKCTKEELQGTYEGYEY